MLLVVFRRWLVVDLVVLMVSLLLVLNMVLMVVSLFLLFIWVEVVWVFRCCIVVVFMLVWCSVCCMVWWVLLLFFGLVVMWQVLVLVLQFISLVMGLVLCVRVCFSFSMISRLVFLFMMKLLWVWLKGCEVCLGLLLKLLDRVCVVVKLVRLIWWMVVFVLLQSVMLIFFVWIICVVLLMVCMFVVQVVIGEFSGFLKLWWIDIWVVVMLQRKDGMVKGDRCCGFLLLVVCIVLVMVWKLFILEVMMVVVCFCVLVFCGVQLVWVRVFCVVVRVKRMKWFILCCFLVVSSRLGLKLVCGFCIWLGIWLLMLMGRLLISFVGSVVMFDCLVSRCCYMGLILQFSGLIVFMLVMMICLFMRV